MYCRYFGINFYAYGALANGILAGAYGTQFDAASNTVAGRRIGDPLSQHIYWRKSFFEAWDVIKRAIDKAYGNNVDYADIMYRWMVHHSKLGENDGVIVGITKYKYFKSTIDSLKRGKPLKEEVVIVIYRPD